LPPKHACFTGPRFTSTVSSTCPDECTSDTHDEPGEHSDSTLLLWFTDTCASDGKKEGRGGDGE
jgi:hypothetical protein